MLSNQYYNIGALLFPPFQGRLDGKRHIARSTVLSTIYPCEVVEITLTYHTADLRTTHNFFI